MHLMVSYLNRYIHNDTHPYVSSKTIRMFMHSGFDIIYNNCAADYDGRKDSGYYVIARKK